MRISDWSSDVCSSDLVFEMSVSSWDDPDRNTGAPFTITVDWGDGTTSQQTVAGTNDDATTFEVSHRYTTELDLATLSYCIHTDSGQLVACFERRNAISIGNMRPFVNAADLSTWPQDHEGLGSNNTIACYAGGGDCVPRAEERRVGKGCVSSGRSRG